MPNYLQWPNSNALASFPFRDDGVLATRQGVRIPDDFLLDARVAVRDGVVPFLQSLEVSGRALTGVLQSESGAVGSFTIGIDQPPGIWNITSPLGKEIGCVVSGMGVAILAQQLGQGVSQLSPDAAVLQVACLTPLPNETLYSIKVGAETLTGKIALAEGEGVVLVSESNNTIRIDAMGSVTQRERCCEAVGQPIKSINLLAPSATGDFTLNVALFSEPLSVRDQRQVLRISPESNGLRFYITS